MKLAAALALLLAFFAAPAGAQEKADPWEGEIRAFEAADRRAPPKPGSVLFVGSSSIRLWSTLADDFEGVDVVNRGFGGSAVADSTRFAGRIVTPYKPRMILLYAGDNDLASGRTPEQVAADFEAFVARVRKDLPDVPIRFIAIKPSPSREHLLASARRANALVAAAAAKMKDVTYVDVFTPMLGPDGKARPELFVEDRLHMNRAGYELWANVIGPVIR